MLEIWTASAGAGKTYKLTGDYLKILLSGGTDRYKSILAVTFTNKATGEMKQRILKELNTLASGGKSGYMKDLMRLERFSKEPEPLREQKVRDHAAALLSAILNDYSLFNVSTIDRFFQQIMRAFAVETGHFSSYNVELNDNSILALAVDTLLDSIDDNEELLQWLIGLSVEAVENGRDWDSVPQLLRLGSELFKEPFKIAVRGAGLDLPGRSEIDECGKIMRGIVKDFLQSSREIGEKALGIIKDCGLSLSDFKGGQRSFIKYFDKLKNAETSEPDAPPASFIKMADELPENWCSASGKSRAADVARAYHSGLAELIRAASDPDRLAEYFTAKEILRNLSVMGILSDIREEVRGYCHRNNIVLLSDTPMFLSDIIDGSDTPFIYEKVGGRLDNYLLDEFQDTSRMQWQNFKPLIANSVDEGHFCMAVGDVKQSIYRWRGSDWRLLDSGINADFDKDKLVRETLPCNWRSADVVREFNNSFFASIGSISGDSLVDRIYSGSAQQAPAAGSGSLPPGHVRVVFAEKGMMGSEGYMQQILDSVRKLLDNGYKEGDIAFLVRTKAEGEAVSEFLISSGFSVMTDDSLKISSSAVVRHAVDRLREISGSAAPLSEDMLREKSLYNICEEIIRTGGDSAGKDGVAFTTAFLDCVLEYIGTAGSDIAGFIEWWDTEGSSRPVSASESRTSFRVITIHKSKGLEFKAVVVPYFRMRLSPLGNFTKYIWCSCSKEPFDKLPVYPLEYRSSLQQTYFKDKYLEEKQLTAVDSFNISYVAFTRAVQELLIFAEQPSSSGLSSVSDALYIHLKDSLEGNVYEQGDWTSPVYKEKAEEAGSIVLEELPSIPIGDRLRLSLPSEEYFPEGEGSARVRGIVMHDILSRVEVAEDLDLAVSAAVDSGMISSNERVQVADALAAMIASVKDRHWFDGTYSLMTEVPIIVPGGDSYRPDRIMFSESEAIVVDYKFGKVRESRYRRQVLGYMGLLRDMGCSSVRGYLWYDKEGVEEIG